MYNRPKEVDELLESLVHQQGNIPFEVLVIEDGSVDPCKEVIENYTSKLDLKYFVTKNQGAGKSRNFGMQKASGDYYIIFDSDCIIPENYFRAVETTLNNTYTDAFGGPDAAHESFTTIQKAINYSMTSFLTTGGIRGKKKAVGKFQPRSFNLGISKKAFEETQGFSEMKIGEDIDLTFRLWNLGFETQLIPEAYVYHKRRTNFSQFYRQTNNFGSARPVLNSKYPETVKLTYWFPSLFLIGFALSVLLIFVGNMFFIGMYLLYFVLVILHSAIQNKNIAVGSVTGITTAIQFYGYGTGFLKSYLFKKI